MTETTIYFQVISISNECNTVDFVLNEYSSEIILKQNEIKTNFSNCIVFASFTNMNYNFINKSCSSPAEIQVFNSTNMNFSRIIFSNVSTFRIYATKCCILRVDYKISQNAGEIGLFYMNYYDYQTDGRNSFKNGLYYIPSTPHFFNTSQNAEIVNNQVPNDKQDPPVLHPGTKFIQISSSVEYSVNKSSFIVFHPKKDQSDFMAVVSTKSKTEYISNKSKILGVFYQESGTILFIATKNYSSLFITVYSNRDNSLSCENRIVLLGNTTALVGSSDYKSQNASITETLTNGKSSCLYSAFVPGYAKMMYSAHGSVMATTYATDDTNYPSSSTNYILSPSTVIATQSAYSHDDGYLTITTQSTNYPFKSGVLTENSNTYGSFIYIPQNKPSMILILAGISAGAFILIMFLAITTYCCITRKAKVTPEQECADDSAESASDTSSSSSSTSTRGVRLGATNGSAARSSASMFALYRSPQSGYHPPVNYDIQQPQYAPISPYSNTQDNKTPMFMPQENSQTRLDYVVGSILDQNGNVNHSVLNLPESDKYDNRYPSANPYEHSGML